MKETYCPIVPELSALAERAGEVPPSVALDLLTQLYIASCGVSLGARSVADYAAEYWVDRWRAEAPEEVPEGVECLYDVMAWRSAEYRARREEIDGYDIVPLMSAECQRLCMAQVAETDDVRMQIALCAGAKAFIDFNNEIYGRTAPEA